MMHVGIERQVDELGRISLPAEYRKLYNWNKKDKLYVIGTEQGVLVYKKGYKLMPTEEKYDI